MSAAGSRLKTQMRQAEDEIARLRLEARQHEAAAQRNGNDAAKAMSQLGLLETKLAAADAEQPLAVQSAQAPPLCRPARIPQALPQGESSVEASAAADSHPASLVDP